MRGRGLKHIEKSPAEIIDNVAPHAGAWIETRIWRKVQRKLLVAPHAGAWIETRRLLLVMHEQERRPSCGGVD